MVITWLLLNLQSMEPSLNKANNNGSNSCYDCCEEGHHLVIAELAKYGADFNKATNNGGTAAFLAAQNGHHIGYC